MKTKSGLIYMVWAVCMSLLSACTDDWEKPLGSGNIEEGIPVKISLDVDVTHPKVVSRASSEANYKVSNLYVWVFNNDNSLDKFQRFEPETDMSDTGNEVTVRNLEVHTGTNKKFYVVANPNSFGTDILTQMEAVKNVDDLNMITARLAAGNSTNIERNYFLMTGKMEPKDGTGTIDIDRESANSHTGVIRNGSTIKLERVDAWITFKVTGKNSKYKDFSFVPDRYWVERIPQGTNVFKQPTDYVETEESETKKSYYSMSDKNIFAVFNPADSEGYYTCDFYMAENRLAPKQRLEADTDRDGAESLYALREKREKTSIPEEDRDPSKPGQTEANGAFKYANDNSTYVIIHGTLSYTDESSTPTKFVNADAYYTIHLGNTGTAADENNVNKVNNYNTERNTHYTYTVTVTGMESMRVEVTENKEVRPGVEGDVIIAGGEVKTMDSHFDRAHFMLTRGALKQGLSWAISTPFQRGMKVFVEEDHKNDKGQIAETGFSNSRLAKLQTDLNLNDYRWIQFVINAEAREENDYKRPVDWNDYAKYPGFKSYNWGDSNVYEGQEFSTAAPPFGGEGFHVGNSYYSNDVKLYDVNQLINHLYVEAHNPSSTLFRGSGDEATVSITAFIDEYIYTYDPREVYYKTPGALADNDPDLLLWKETVNGTNRMLHLCTSKEIYSPDGNTSLAESVITFSQHPIYTFYDKNNPDVKTAWGTESNTETGKLEAAINELSTKHANTHDNGRQNTLNILPQYSWIGLEWTDVIDMNVGDNKKLKSGYENVWYATLLRNRDINGDNIVQESEIRWYLASIDQLTDLWIGQWSLNQEAWLYHGDGSTRSHVASSSYYTGNYGEIQGQPSNPYVLWAEEGASVGDWNYSHQTQGEMYDYRCIRNLGLSLDNINGTPEDYIVKLPDGQWGGNREKRLDLSKLEYNSLRSAKISGIQANHHERELDNRPYTKLAVIGDSNSPSYGLYPSRNEKHGPDYYQRYERVSSPCPTGYRIPNQRELMLLYTAFPELFSMEAYDGYFLAKTGFSFNGNSLYDTGNRYGFAYYSNYQTFILTQGNSNDGKVRCVRDM